MHQYAKHNAKMDYRILHGEKESDLILYEIHVYKLAMLPIRRRWHLADCFIFILYLFGRLCFAFLYSIQLSMRNGKHN